MFGTNLRKLRKAKGDSQIYLSKIFGVSQATISSWEKERTYPPYSDLIKLADYFNVSIDYLIGRTDNNANFTLNVGDGNLQAKLNSLSFKEKAIAIALLDKYLEIAH